MTRGIKPSVDLFINSLLAQPFPYMKDGKNHTVQCGVRPIQLWEVVVPENSMGDLQQAIWTTNAELERTVANWKHKLGLNIIRKTLGAEKIPKFEEKKMKRFLWNDSTVCVYPIGVKKDNYKNGTEEL